jgi:tripartite-type tricarboxylate transporter receptor subunit TctC
VRIVVPFPAGQGADATARALARQLEAVAGQPFVVDNRPGGNNAIGAAAVIASPPDGYTLFYGSQSPMASNAVFFKQLGYDPVKDFSPVALLARSTWVLVVSTSSRYATYADVVAHARADPKAVSYAAGSTTYQLVGEMLSRASGIQMNIVPYKGTPQALTDVAGGQVTITAIDVGSAAPLIAAQRLRPLLMFAEQRHPQLPDVPSLKDAGIIATPFFSWNAIFAPAGTPLPLRERLAQLVTDAANSEPMRKFIAGVGAEPMLAGPERLAAFQRQEIETYRAAMRAARLEPQ